MPGASRPGAHFRVDFDDATFAEDLEHTSSDTGRELAQRERDKLTDEGLPSDQLKRCDTEARDGTSLPGCVKIYIPEPDGTWGMVFQLRIGSDRRPFLACLAFGKPRQPWMERTNQSRANMAEAMAFVRKNLDPSDLVFTDYQSDLILGHYLCRQRPISFDLAPTNFEEFNCDGYRIASTDYKTAWMLWADDFPKDWQRLVEAYNLRPGDTVWVFQAGWGVGLPEDLRKHFAEFRDLRFESFGKNIKIFKMTVGQPTPAVSP